MRANRALLVGLTAATLVLPVSIGVPRAAGTSDTGSPTLVDVVPTATARFRNIDNALADGYVINGGCVSGPELGAMGVHYAKFSLFDAVLDVNSPEVLVYEPRAGRAASRRRGVRHAGGRLERRPSRGDAATERTPPPLHERPQSLRPRRLLRAARVGLEAEPEQPVRGLESAGLLRGTPGGPLAASQRSLKGPRARPRETACAIVPPASGAPSDEGGGARDEQHTCHDGHEPDGARHAQTGWRDTFERDRRGHRRHRGEVHDAGEQQDQHQVAAAGEALQPQRAGQGARRRQRRAAVRLRVRACSGSRPGAAPSIE